MNSTPRSTTFTLRSARTLGLLLLAALPAQAAASCTGPAPRSSRPSAPIAATDDVQAWLDAGRALLERGDARGAQELFAKAAAAEPDSLRTRTWVLRGWIALDRINDTLDEIDALAKTHKGAPELAYLYGLAFFRMAEQKIASGKTDAQLGMNYQDATAYLKEACAARRPEFNDAWLPLSKAAWNAQDNETALSAGEEAVKAYPQRVDAWRQLASAALANHVATAQSEPDAAARHVARSIEACGQALTLAGIPQGPADARTVADIELGLGDALAWKSDVPAAGAAYARALALDPTIVDVGALLQRLGTEGFHTMILAALRGFAERYGAEDARDATLTWWAGSASFSMAKHAEAETWFQLALKKAPTTLSSWYYLARARTARGDGMGAAEALRKHWESNQADLVAWLAYASFAEQNRAMLAWVSGNCFKRAEALRNDGKLLESLPCIEAALVVSEIRTAWLPDDPEAWSNLGLFTRDQGDVTSILRRQNKALPDPKPLWERAYEAYTKSLALDDKNPDTLNDTAVILHYNLRRDYAKARELYNRALARAEEQLQDAQLDAATREHLTNELIVWVKDNLRKLDAEENRDAGAETGAPADAGADSPRKGAQ
jgi:tetratricopeptide (TPR) repeat protein